MALTTQVGLEFIARNMANRQISSFTRSIQRMGRQMLALAGVGGGLYSVKRGLDYVIKASTEQEKAERLLSAAVQGSIAQYKIYASQMQTLTVYGDEQILSQMAYAKNLGVTTDKLQEATTAAIGLSAKYRLDLAAAMMLIGRASQGQTQMLTRYGIVIDQNLSTEEKFNEILKIGIKNFRLAEEQAEDAAGSFSQWGNEASDLAEIIGNPLKKALAEQAKAQTEYMRSFKADFARWISDMEEGIEMVERFDKAILNAYKKVYQYSPWGLVYKGYKKLTKPESIAKPGAKYDYMTKFPPLKKPELDYQLPAWVEETVQREKEVGEIAKKYLPALRTEIALTGKLGEARAHARQVMKLENDLREKGLEKSAEGIRLMERQAYWLKELEKAQRLARIADDIGSAFANAFEDIRFEAKKLDEVMRSIIRSIDRSVMQNLIFQPMGLAISGAISGGLSGLFGNAGSKMKAIAEPGYYGHKGIPADFMPRLHGGLKSDEFAAIIQRGEEIIPKSDAGKRGGNLIIQFENRGTPQQMMGYEQRDAEDQRIVRIVVDDAEQDGPVRRMVKEVIANVE